MINCIIFNSYAFTSLTKLPELIMETCNVVLTFNSIDKILWYDHSNQTSSAIRLWHHLFFNILQNKIWGFS